MKVLTQQQSEFYKEQGYVIIENFLSPAEIDHLKGALNRLVEERTKHLTNDEEGFNLEKVHKEGAEINNLRGEAIAGVLRKIQEITKYSPEFREFAEGDKLLNLVEDLIGPNIYYHSSKIMFKPARHGGIKPWHQDYAYWASLKPEQVTCWMALDDATPENGCMQLIPGSHKWGLVKHIRDELQVDPKNLPLEMVKVAPMKAGSILCFHVLTFHYSGPNTSDKSRRALIVDYDPNQRIAKEGFAGDKLLRLNGHKPTPAEVAESVKVAEAVTA